jgi:shikimate dehydrogenase
MNNNRRIFGLIGKSLSHSYSQHYFAEKFSQNNITDAEYRLFSLARIQEIKELLALPSLLGFNVTVPYKTEIIPFLDELDAVSQEVGAVNCVVKQNNRWVGYNTDVIGFENVLQKIEVQEFNSSVNSCGLTLLRSYCLTNIFALILGTGGASKAVCYVLKQRNIPFQIVSREKAQNTITYHEITKNIIHHHSLIINTTPLGMFPNTNEMPPIPYPALSLKHTLIDLIYNPEETLFLLEGKKRGALTINGLEMFKAQAEANWGLFKI